MGGAGWAAAADADAADAAATNKLPRDLDNPLDNWLMDASARLLPHLWESGHTPNLITTYSFVCGLGAVYALHTGGAGPVFAVLHILAYFFDVVDGQLARTYCMVSRFGDLYDHTTDAVVFVALAYVVWLRYRPSLAVAAVFAAFGSLTLMHLGCQQRWYNRRRAPPPPDGDHDTPDDDHEEETLDTLERTCPGVRWLPVTRYFGAGTLQLVVIVGLVFWLEHQKGRRRGGKTSAAAGPPG